MSVKTMSKSYLGIMSDKKWSIWEKFIAKIDRCHTNRGNSYTYSLDNSAEQVNILFS